MPTASKRTTTACSSVLLLTTLHVMLVAVAESHSIAVITALQTSSSSSDLDNWDAADTYSDDSDSENYYFDDRPQNDGTDAFERLVDPENPEMIRPIENELLLVTVLKESRSDGQNCIFWVDSTLVYMTVTVDHTELSDWVLADKYGTSVRPIISTWGTKRWTVHRPTVGAWHLLHEGDTSYKVSVRGASSMNLEVSLYHTDITTGFAEIVHDTPTAGHQILTIIDIIGGDVIRDIYNVTLVTSDGTEVASDWLRPSGSPQDPQYKTTFTWPTQSVYVRVFGREVNGNLLERQTPYVIKPILFDLQLLGNPLTTGVVSADTPLLLEYLLTNHGPSGTFVLSVSLDNTVFSAVLSPKQIRLGHLGTFAGRVTVSVQRETPNDTTGMLTVNAWLTTQPSVIQSSVRFLTSHSDFTDRDPPFCETTSVTGDCLEQDVTSSSTCHLRRWVVRASLDDAGSGLSSVTFDDMTHKEEDVRHSVAPFTEGQANEPVEVVFNTTCCIPEVTLNTSDVAKNQGTCRFYRHQMIPAVPKPSSSHQPPHPSERRTTARLQQGKQPTTASRAPATTATSSIVSITSRLKPIAPSSAAHPSRKPGSLHISSTGRPPMNSAGSASVLSSGPVTKVMSSSGVGTDSTTPIGVAGSDDTRGRTTTGGGGHNGVGDTVDGETGQSTPQGGGFAAPNSFTRHRGGKADHSTVKTAAIILGSIGGVGGLGIAAICLVLLHRHRRLQQRQRYCSSNSSGSSGSDTTGDNDSRSGQCGPRGERGLVPDLVPASSSRRQARGEFSTPL